MVLEAGVQGNTGGGTTSAVTLYFLLVIPRRDIRPERRPLALRGCELPARQRRPRLPRHSRRRPQRRFPLPVTRRRSRNQRLGVRVSLADLPIAPPTAISALASPW